MTGRTHQFIGFTTVYTFALLASYDSFNLQTVVFGVVLISLGALMPDLDSEDNVIYSLVPVGRRVISEIFERVFGRHRSISHSLLGIFLFGLLSHWLIFRIPGANGLNLSALWYAYFISLVMHVVADMLTKDGVPLLWPLRVRFGFPPFKFLRIKTGGWFEMYVVNGFLIVWIFVLSFLYFDRLFSIFQF